MKISVFIVMMILFQDVFGCSGMKANWVKEDWSKNPDRIYHGVVTSTSLIDFPINQSIKDYKDGAVVIWWGNRKIKMNVIETLKGPKKSVVNAKLKRCIGGSAELSEQIVLFRVEGEWHAKPLSHDDIAIHVEKTLTKMNRKEP